MQVWNVQHAAGWNTARKKSPKIRHRGTIAQICRVYLRNYGTYLQSEKKLVKQQQYLLQMSSQYGERRPANGWHRFTSLGHPANLNRFGVLASLLERRRSTEANKTLHDLWSSPGLVHYIYIFGGFCPWRNSGTCKIHFASKSCVLIYWQRYCTTLQQRASDKLCGVVQGMEWRNLNSQRVLSIFSAGRLSHWASAHILVCIWRSKNALSFCDLKVVSFQGENDPDKKEQTGFNSWRRVL